MNLIFKILFVIFVLQLPTKINAADFSFGTKFFNYGNGAINLDNVTYIVPSWNYNYYYQSSTEEPFQDFSEVPDKNTIAQRVEDLYGDGTWGNNIDFYFFRNSSQIMFDNFTLTILSEITFFKIPSCVDIDARSDFMEFAEGAALKFDISTYEDGWCQKLQSKQNLMTLEGIAEVKRGLLDTAVTYSKVVN
jgi:hypothetical protein